MSDGLISIELDADERLLLRQGMNQWGGPDKCTMEMAVAMGFADLDDLYSGEGERLWLAIGAEEALTAFDWCRILLATEIAFASNLIGAGRDWIFTAGLSDEDSLRLLRKVQRKMPREVYGVIGRQLGTQRRSRPDQRP